MAQPGEVRRVEALRRHLAPGPHAKLTAEQLARLLYSMLVLCLVLSLCSNQ